MMDRTVASSAALAEELRNVVFQAEALLQAVADDKDEALGALRERVSGAVETARNKLADIETHARRAAQRASVATEAYVRENPWTVISGAATAGLLLGALFTRGMNSADADQ